MRGQLRNQLHALQHGPVVIAQVRQRMKDLDQALTAQLAEVDAELLALFPTENAEILNAGEPSPEQAWAITLAKSQTIPGIGLLTAMWIVVGTLNFTICVSAEQARPDAAGIGHQCLQTPLYRPYEHEGIEPDCEMLLWCMHYVPPSQAYSNSAVTFLRGVRIPANADFKQVRNTQRRRGSMNVSHRMR